MSDFSKMSDTLSRTGGAIVDTSNNVQKLQNDILKLDKTPLTNLKKSFANLSKSISFIQNMFNLPSIVEELGGRIIKLGIEEEVKVMQDFQEAAIAGGQFYDMSEKISQTLGGQLSLAMDNIDSKLLAFYKIIQPYLLPAMRAFNLLLTDAGTFIDKMVTRLEDWYNNNLLLGTSILVLTSAWLAYKSTLLVLNGVQALIAVWRKAVIAYEIVVFAIKNATNLWTAAQWLLNVALDANPLGAIIALVVAIIAAIAFCIIKVDGWGKTWDNVLTMCELGFKIFKNSIKIIWLGVQNSFLSGFEIIEKGWYKLQSLFGSKKAEAALERLKNESNARNKELEALIVELGVQMKQLSDMKVIAFSMNETSFGDIWNKGKSMFDSLFGSTFGTSGNKSGTGNGIGTGGMGDIGEDAVNTISTGGPKTTNITLTINELGNNMTINANSVREGAQRIREIVQDELTRALLMAQTNI